MTKVETIDGTSNKLQELLASESVIFYDTTWQIRDTNIAGLNLVEWPLHFRPTPMWLTSPLSQYWRENSRPLRRCVSCCRNLTLEECTFYNNASHPILAHLPYLPIPKAVTAELWMTRQLSIDEGDQHTEERGLRVVGNYIPRVHRAYLSTWHTRVVTIASKR